MRCSFRLIEVNENIVFDICTGGNVDKISILFFFFNSELLSGAMDSCLQVKTAKVHSEFTV